MPTPRFRKLAAARLAVAEPISPAVSSLFDGEGGASALSTRSVPVARLSPLPGQPARQINPTQLATLAESIAEHGVLEPVLVRPVGSGFQIIAGERRWRAAILAGLEKIPAVIREMDDLTALQTAIGESIDRQVAESVAQQAQAAPLVAPIVEPAIPVAPAQPFVAQPATVTIAPAQPLVAQPATVTIAPAQPLAVESVAAPLVAPAAMAPAEEASDEDDLLDRIGAIWLRARELAASIEAERGELSSYDRERARKTLLSIRIAADNGATLLRD